MSTTILLALVIGGAFGFVLDRIGATNPNYIIGMLRLSRLHLMKTILLAIGVASIGMFGGILAGVIDVGHMSVKAAYTGVVLGGILLGIGFAVAGYCPGTGLAAAFTGRMDGVFFIIGGLVGAFAYMLSYDWVRSTGVLANILGGKATIGAITGTKWTPLFAGLPGEVFGIIAGVVFVLIAFMLPNSLTGEDASKAADASA